MMEGQEQLDTGQPSQEDFGIRQIGQPGDLYPGQSPDPGSEEEVQPMIAMVSDDSALLDLNSSDFDLLSEQLKEKTAGRVDNLYEALMVSDGALPIETPEQKEFYRDLLRDYGSTETDPSQEEEVRQEVQEFLNTHTLEDPAYREDFHQAIYDPMGYMMEMSDQFVDPQGNIDYPGYVRYMTRLIRNFNE